MKTGPAGGFTGLFRGLVTSCGREGLFTAGYMGIGPSMKEFLQKNKIVEGEAGSKLGGAIAGGVIAATLSHPLDTIKTCMQGDIKRERFGTFTETASTLMKENGIGGFFKGWSWRTGRMICAVAIMGECKTQLGPLFFPHHFQE